MPLINFGSILNFAEELEKEDKAFYETVAVNPDCETHREMFEKFAADAKKNITIQRTRRENVTEMILESIENFTRAPFCIACGNAAEMTAAEALETAKNLEERAERYYLKAAEKIKALSEVARALKLIAKKRAAHRNALTSAD